MRKLTAAIVMFLLTALVCYSQNASDSIKVSVRDAAAAIRVSDSLQIMKAEIAEYAVLREACISSISIRDSIILKQNFLLENRQRQIADLETMLQYSMQVSDVYKTYNEQLKKELKAVRRRTVLIGIGVVAAAIFISR